MPRRQTARAEVHRNIREVLARLKEGETLIFIHDDLRQRGLIDCAYRTFSKWVRRLERKLGDPKQDHGTPFGSPPKLRRRSFPATDLQEDRQ